MTGDSDDLYPHSVTKWNGSGQSSDSQDNQAVLILLPFDSLLIATAGNSDYLSDPSRVSLLIMNAKHT